MSLIWKIVGISVRNVKSENLEDSLLELFPSNTQLTTMIVVSSYISSLSPLVESTNDRKEAEANIFENWSPLEILLSLQL